MATLLALAVGGALGTLTRYGADVSVERRSFAVPVEHVATASVTIRMLAVLLGQRAGRV
jgi:fluoride ion exporter CrcB/FEX